MRLLERNTRGRTFMAYWILTRMHRILCAVGIHAWEPLVGLGVYDGGEWCSWCLDYTMKQEVEK